jgi:thymidine phosphorylase
MVRLGQFVEKNQPLCVVHAASDTAAEAAANAVHRAVTIGAEPDLQPLVHERIS